LLDFPRSHNFVERISSNILSWWSLLCLLVIYLPLRWLPFLWAL
jgi:hypothetical protein